MISILLRGVDLPYHIVGAAVFSLTSQRPHGTQAVAGCHNSCILELSDHILIEWELSVRILLFFGLILAVTGQAWADPAQCEKVLSGGSAAQIEKYCSHLKNSKLKFYQAGYYQAIGMSYGAEAYNAGSSPAFANAAENLTKAIALLSESEARREKIKPALMRTQKSITYSSRGLLYLQNKEPGQVTSKDAQKALQDLDLAISFDPNDAQSHLWRGYAHNQLLNPRAAWADFQKAKALDPSDPSILDAYEKQRRISPEGQAETLRELEEIQEPTGAR